MDETTKRELAWVGDAVLALYARRWILEQKDIPVEERTNAFIAMTSNSFLACFGEPTAIEAKIGSIYQNDSLEKAFEWIETTCLPTFQKQRLNLNKGHRGKKLRRG